MAISETTAKQFRARKTVFRDGPGSGGSFVGYAPQVDDQPIRGGQ
jgi:hypothetical protein